SIPHLHSRPNFDAGYAAPTFWAHIPVRVISRMYTWPCTILQLPLFIHFNSVSILVITTWPIGYHGRPTAGLPHHISLVICFYIYRPLRPKDSTLSSACRNSASTSPEHLSPSSLHSLRHQAHQKCHSRPLTH